MMDKNILEWPLTFDDVCEQLIEIADSLRLKSQHNPLLDDIFVMGDRIEDLVGWLINNIGD